MRDNKLLFTIFLIAMVSIGWGVAFLSLAILLKHMAPMQVLAARWSLTALLFLCLILFGKVRIDLSSFKGNGRDALFLFLAGLFEPCAYSILEAYGIKMTSASISAIFVATIPCMTLILGIVLFKNKADAKLVNRNGHHVLRRYRRQHVQPVEQESFSPIRRRDRDGSHGL